MIERGWLQEVDANLRRGEPIWRDTGDGHGTTLVVTDTGLLVIGIEPAKAQRITADHKRADDTTPGKQAIQRAGTKQAMLIALLKAPQGAPGTRSWLRPVGSRIRFVVPCRGRWARSWGWR